VYGPCGIDGPESLTSEPWPQKGGRRGPLLNRERAEGGQNEKLHIEPTEGQHFTFSTIIKTRKGAEGTFLEARN
jgi:hypothetical protein